MLTVHLKDHQYDIQVKRGCLAQVGPFLQDLWQPQKVAIITDDNVASLYEEQVRVAVMQAGFEVVTHIVPHGETSKSLAKAEEIYAFLADEGFTRSDGIIALGGGVIGDLAAFAASTYMRGIHFIQIPTTLLAQVDSSIGGKTAVNTAKAKNLVGTFSQPDGVLIDPDVLQTLAPRRIREGIAEIIKSAAIADLALWHHLEKLPDEDALLADAEYVITETLKVKQKVVEADEFDNGMRLILNFGHTIGHAVEKTAGYGVISHGEGVAIGMMKINQHAEAQGLSPQGSTAQLKELIEKFHLPTTTENWDETALYEAITHDKKARGDHLKLILLAAIGEAKIVTLPLTDLRAYLKAANS